MSTKTKSQLEIELRTAQAQIAQLQRALQEAQQKSSAQTIAMDDPHQDERLRQLLEILPVGISVLDDERKVVFQNSALSQVLDITAEGLQTGAYKNRRYLSADGSPMPLDEPASTWTIRSGQPTYNLETGVVKEDGETIWTNISAVPVNFPDWKTVLVTTDITERKRAEEKLRQSEERYKLISENAADVIWVMDPMSGTFTYVSPSVERLCGYTPEEVTAQHFNEALTPESIKIVSESLQQNLPAFIARGSRTESFINEVDQPHKDGSIVHTKVTTTYAFNERGEVEIVGVSRDITQRKQEAERWQKSELLFRTLFALSPDAVILIDPHDPTTPSSIVDCNTTACLMNGYHRDELVGQSIEILNAAPFSDTDRIAYLERLRKEGPLKFEVFHRHKDGTIFPVETSTTIIQVGERELLIGIDRDIAERKRAEKDLQESQRNLQLFVEYSPAAIAMFDRDMRYIAASRRFIADYHLPIADVIGRSHYEIFPEIPERWKAIHRRCLAGAVEMAEADPFPRGDGTIDWVRWEIHPWYGSDGQIGGIILFSEVITNRIELEQERAKLTERLDLATRSAHMGIWDWDIQKNEIIWDDQMYALYGLQPGEFSGAYEAWLHGVHPEDREPSNEVSAASVRGEREYDTEFRVLWPDGSVHWLKANGQVFRDENGTPLRMVGVNYDITERKRAEQEVRESRELFQKLFDLSPVAYSLARISDHQIVEVNPACENLFGYSKAESVGKRTMDLDFWVDQNELKRATEEFRRNGELRNFEFAYKTRSGTMGWAISYTNLIQQGEEKFILSEFVNITERKRAEEALRQSQENFARAFDSNPAALAITRRANGEFILMNDSYTSIMGYSKSEIIGRTVTEFSIYANPQERAELLQRLVEQGRVVNHELTVRAKNQEHRYILISMEPILYDTENCILSTFIDITERKLAEEALKQSEERFSKAFFTSPLSQSILSMQTGEVVEVNDACCRLYEYSREELIGADPGKLNLWANPADEVSVLEELQRTGHLIPREITIRVKSGEIHTIIFSTEPIIWKKVPCLISSSIDITGRKRAEDQLRESEQKYRELINGMNDTIWVIDFDTAILDINDAASAVLGYTREELLSMKVSDIDLSLRPEQIRHLASTMTSVTSQVFESIHSTKDGRQIPVEVSSSLVTYMGRTAIMGIARDITERKQAEDTLRESNERFRQIAGTIQEVFWMFDNVQQRLLYVSPAFEAVWGRSINDVFDGVNRYMEFILPEDHPRMLEVAEQQARGNTTELEYRIKRPDGTIRWIHDRSFPVLDANGVLSRTTGIATDITNRKQAEEDTLFRQELLEKVIQLGKKIAAITDLDTCLYEIYQSARFGLGFDRIGFFLYDGTIQHVLGIYGTSRTGEIQPPGFYDASIDGFGGWQRALQSPIGISWQEDYQKRFDLPEDHEMYGVRNHLIVAAWAGEKPVALITADNLLTDRDIKPYEIEALQLFAGYAGLAIENATLHTELELKVEERTAEVQDLYDNAPAGYHSLDANGCFMQINATELKWLGYSRQEVIGHAFSEFITEKSRAIFRKNFPIFKQRGWVRDLEFEMVRKDGSILPALVNATAIFDPKGNYVMSRSTVFDITEQHKAAEALRESEARYRRAISAADAIPYSFDYATNTYTFIGENVERLTGYPTKELTPELLNSFVLEIRMRGELAGYSVTEATQRIRNRELPGNVVWQSDIHIRNKEGKERWWSDVAVQVLNEQNELVGAIGILQDITERMDVEETLRLANIELERALRMKDEFLASMSHELRTPLTGILGLSEALQYDTYGVLSQKQKSVIGNIENNGRHLLELINDILDLSKMEAGKFELEMLPCQLSDICQSSLQLVKGMAHKKGQNVAFFINPASILVKGDARRLKQIVVNLLSNAVKYSPENSAIGLEVTADRAAQNVHIEVWDKGMGIASEDLNRLFQPFVQLDSSLSRQQTGTGLGLALVQRLVELHGGNIQVESAPGQGSHFTVTLPYLPGEMEHPVELPAQIQKSLIVEDSPVDADRLTRFLKQLGIHSTVLPKGAGVVEKAATLQPGVILLDINLPDTTGWEVLEKLKQNERTRDIPVVITSIEEDRERAKQIGAAGYLVKLFTLDELRLTLSHIPKPEGAYNDTALVVSPEVHLGTVVIVDDNETNILMIEDFLRSKNYNIFSSSSGEDFLARVNDIQPDIVLMDIQMPVMDGLETIRRLRLFPTRELASVPVIAITALAMPGDRERCIEAGADEYISKPIRLKELVALIQKMMAENENANE